MWQDTGRRLIDIVTMNPGISRGEIAGALGISGPSVTRWLRQYIDQGLFREERDGRFTRYYAVISVATQDGAILPGKSSGTG
jgi:DNA-binding MarR family transcriptional regulator